MMEIIYVNKNNTMSRLKKRKSQIGKNLIKTLRPTFILPYPLAKIYLSKDTLIDIKISIIKVIE